MLIANNAIYLLRLKTVILTAFVLSAGTIYFTFDAAQVSYVLLVCIVAADAGMTVTLNTVIIASNIPRNR